MIRFLMYLFGKKDYESCQSCSVYKAQLEISNIEKRELYETLLKLVKPEVIHQVPPSIVNPIPVMQRFSQRRQELERMNAAVKETKQRSPFIAKGNAVNIPTEQTTAVKSETIDEMEMKLGLTSEVNDASKVS